MLIITKKKKIELRWVNYLDENPKTSISLIFLSKNDGANYIGHRSLCLYFQVSQAICNGRSLCDVTCTVSIGFRTPVCSISSRAESVALCNLRIVPDMWTSGLFQYKYSDFFSKLLLIFSDNYTPILLKSITII